MTDFQSLRIAVVLGGGGLKGFAHIGVLRALDEIGLQPAVWAGTSIGALIAAARVGGMSIGEMAHRAAGLRDVEARLLREVAPAADARAHWQALARENGHVRRADAELDEERREAVVAEVAARLERYRGEGGLAVPRTLVLVTARR